MNFLIVNDSSAMCKMVKRALEQSGYQDHVFEFAENGQEAYEMLYSQDIPLDIYDNCVELLKVCESLFHDAIGNQILHYKLTHLISTDTNKLKSLLTNPKSKRIDIMVEIVGYGAGRMTLITF